MKIRAIPTRLFLLLQSPRLLSWLLAYFMGVLVIGTIAQKYIGLFQATHLFFNSFIYWLGPLPVPAGASMLALLFINLLCHFITKSRWTMRHIGTTLAHLSVLVLLLGGGVTLFSKKEGFIILRRNEAVQNMYDYHAREFLVVKNGRVIGRHNFAALKDDIIADSLKIKIAKTMRNATMQKEILTELPIKRDDEINQAGLAIAVNGMDIVTTEFLQPQPERLIGKDHYRFILQRRKSTMPFSLLLQNFKQDYYQGTEIAQNYQSSLLVVEAGREWPVQISMNEPLRYKNYTLYQSSVLTLPNGETASVLNAVDNTGWLFPYIATAMMFTGLVLQLWVRRRG
ncbi:MAG: ResB family protein [Alphaproteobacteria bacterium]|nr:ResB family protein [Alphaproteobacteria bacterium]